MPFLLFGLGIRTLHFSPHGKGIRKPFRVRYLSTWLFTLYRLRTPDTHKSLLISNRLVNNYSENQVDTLHMKNLLHLGEDRYLTTLLLKHFPLFKTRFVRDAHAFTVAPDDWKVLLSQHRHWITLHFTTWANLFSWNSSMVSAVS